MVLSACLIVRDEESHLDACLSSIEPYVDEIVVLDTGSTDDTPQIAGRHGARLFRLSWAGDFAAARNEALEKAKGAWILIIDADETLRPIPVSEIRGLLESPRRIAYHTWLCPKAGWTEMRTLRLFRNHPRIRYRGAIHESVGEGLQERLAAGDGEIGECGITLDHTGFEADQRAKHERNIPLLLAELGRDPDKLWDRQHLAHCYYESGRRAEAEALWQENVCRLRGKTGATVLDSLSHAALIQLLLADKRDALPLLAEALASFPGNPEFTWLQGKELMSRRRFEEALPCFERLVHRGRDRDYDRSISYESRMFDAHAYEAMAVCHFRLARYRESRRCFEIARTYIPDSVEYAVKGRLCAVLEKKRSGDPAHR